MSVELKKIFPKYKIVSRKSNVIHSFDDGVKAWKRRVARMNYDKLHITLVERDGCTYDDLLAFDALPHEHKVAFTRLSYKDIKCSFHIIGFEKEKELGMLMDFYGYTGKCYYDQFD